VIEFSKFLEDCSSGYDTVSSHSEFLVWDDLVHNLSNSPKVETSFRSPCCGLYNPSLPRLVPLCSSNSIGYLRTCFFEPYEHLLLYLADSVNERYNAIDRYFHVLDSLVCNKREIIDLDLPPLSRIVVSAVQASPGNGSHLLRVERNLLMVQRLRAQSKHFCPSELEFLHAGNRNQEPRNSSRMRLNYFELTKE
jgi:hypothetical protein